jgi:hypothetical protein
MPINSARFERGNAAVFSELTNLFRSNPHLAYTLDELRDMLAAKDIDMSKTELTSLLGSMEYGGRIVSRTVDGDTYYKYRKVLGFMPMKKIR